MDQRDSVRNISNWDSSNRNTPDIGQRNKISTIENHFARRRYYGILVKIYRFDVHVVPCNVQVAM